MEPQIANHNKRHLQKGSRKIYELAKRGFYTSP